MSSITEFQGTPDDVEQAVATPLVRSRLPVESNNHRFSVLIEEWVLRARIGDTPMTAGQLGYLLAVMPTASLSLEIIPLNAQPGVWPLEAF